MAKCAMQDIYPKTIEDTVRLLNNHKIMSVKQVATSHHEEEEVAFVQWGE